MSANYGQADALLLFFSLISDFAIENIREKWIPHIKTFFPNAPIILVGTKKDLRQVGGPGVKREDGLKLKKQIRAADYIECSAKTRKGCEEVFNAVLNYFEKSKCCCCSMM